MAKLYTGKGDKGDTKDFSSKQRISKASSLFDALGSLDELISYLGLVKVQCRTDNFLLPDNTEVSSVIHKLQNDLFSLQAEVAGAEYSIRKTRVEWLEKIIADIEKNLPDIKTFSIPGGTELSGRLDFARTIARRAERAIVKVHESGERAIKPASLAYLNRLSSILYALARFANYQRGVKEDAPRY